MAHGFAVFGVMLIGTDFFLIKGFFLYRKMNLKKISHIYTEGQ